MKNVRPKHCFGTTSCNRNLDAEALTASSALWMLFSMWTRAVQVSFRATCSYLGFQFCFALKGKRSVTVTGWFVVSAGVAYHFYCRVMKATGHARATLRSAFPEQELEVERVLVLTCLNRLCCNSVNSWATPSECSCSSRKPLCCEYTTMPGLYLKKKNYGNFENTIYPKGAIVCRNRRTAVAAPLPVHAHYPPYCLVRACWFWLYPG